MAGTGQRRLFCFGLGYCARILAADLIGEGWAVAGTCRAASRAAELAAIGATVHPFDGTRPLSDTQSALAGTTHLLGSIPPDAQGDPAVKHHRAAIAALAGLDWIGYLSSTGVYGDHGGALVDERAAPRPVSEHARRRVRAERQWLELWRAHGLPVHLFRLAGLYGPGRSAIDRLRAGQARRIDKPGHRFARIHVADVARALRASMAKPRPGAIYNLCDDEPAPAADVVAHAAGLLGVEPPPLMPFEQAAAEMSPMARAFWADDRRVSNALLHDELGVELRYPSYREGLAAIVAAG